MGKGGASKGAKGASKGAATSTVAKPWLKKTVTTGFVKPGAKAKAGTIAKGWQSTKSAPVKSSPWAPAAKPAKSSGKGKSSTIPAKTGKGGGKGQWVWQPEKKPVTKGKGGGKSKGKGKGKGKKRLPAGLKSSFWTNKLEGETRQELGGSYSGVITMYKWAQGWGLIRPDSAESLPDEVQAALVEAAAAAAAKAAEKGKEVSEESEGLIYFRKPDVNHQEGFKLAGDTTVTFSLYMDEKGAGAYDIGPA